MKQLKHSLDPTIFNWEIPTSLFHRGHESIRREFVAVGYVFQFQATRQDNALQVHFCLRNGQDYDKLDWPFRAKYHTRFTSRNYPDEASEFKSEVIEKKREDLDSNDIIAVIPIPIIQLRRALRRYLFLTAFVLEITVEFC